MINRLFAALILCIIPALTGCQAVQGYLNSMPKPSAEVVGTHLGDLKTDSANLLFDVKITNPYSAALPLVNLDYSLASGGKPFLTGSAPVQGSIPANGSSTISLPANVQFARILSALQGVKLGSVIPYDAALNLSVDAPAVGKLTLPLKKSGQLPIPAIPAVELADVEWKGLDFTRAEAVLHVKITNTNQFNLNLTKLSLGLNLAGHTIASTAVDQGVSLAPGAQGTLDIPVGFSPQQLGLSAFTMLQGKGSEYKISGLISTNSPFGPLNLPYERSGSTSFRSK